jgi:hypothetical protein
MDKRMRFPNLVEKYLDGEKLFRHYYGEMGRGATFHKLARWAAENGMECPEPRFDKRLGWTNVPSDMGVLKACWRWASLKENKDKAYEYFQVFMQQRGDYCSPEEWRTLVMNKAKVAWQYSPDKYQTFLVKNGWV